MVMAEEIDSLTGVLWAVLLVVVEVLLLVAVVRDVWLELLLVELMVLVVILMVSILRV